MDLSTLGGIYMSIAGGLGVALLIPYQKRKQLREIEELSYAAATNDYAMLIDIRADLESRTVGFHKNRVEQELRSIEKKLGQLSYPLVIDYTLELTSHQYASP